jgi:ADP-ribose pyrophosphatase
MWKKLSTKTILDHKRLKVVEDQVELPNGEVTDYIRIDQLGNQPTVIAINRQNKILVIKEYFYVTHKWLYLFPGGFVPADESIEDGIKRELVEETGVVAKKWSLIGSLYPQVRRSSIMADVFVARELDQGTQRLETEEQIEILWLTENEIDQLIKEGKFRVSASLAAWAIYKVNKQFNCD